MPEEYVGDSGATEDAPREEETAETRHQRIVDQMASEGHDYTAIEKAKDMVKAAYQLSKAVVGPKVEREEFNERQAICEACTALNPEGKRLFRMAWQGAPVCGQPKYLDTEPRNETEEGCGCFLTVKWKAKNEHCPLGKW